MLLEVMCNYVILSNIFSFYWCLQNLKHLKHLEKGLRLHCAVRIFTLTLFRQWRHTESTKHIMFAPNCVVSVIIKPWGVVDRYFYCNMFLRRGFRQWHHPLHESTRSFRKTSSAWGAFPLEKSKVHSLTPETKTEDFFAILHNNH